MLDQLSDGFLQFIYFLYQATGDNLGLALILMTLLIRFALLPLTLKSQKSAHKMREIQPEVNDLKKKHKGDNQALQKATMELYKNYNINPFAGCLPQILQLVILIFLYRVLINFFGVGEINGITINTQFLWMDLANPDQLYVLPFLAFAVQMVLSLMIAPGGEIRDVVPNKSKKKKVQEENKKEEGMADMAATMQKQMIFIMPVMTGVIALNFPSGVALYWVATTVFSVVQQYYISGWGGLVSYTQRGLAFLTGSKKL